MDGISKFPIENVLEEVKDFNINLGSNVYYKDERKVPRVTQVLSETLDQSYLIKWANRIGLGRKNYDEVLSRAGDIGTLAHNTIEHFIRNETKPDYKVEDDMQCSIPFRGFKLWWDEITKNNLVLVVLCEHTMTNDYFGGTLDLLISINGRYFLVDFKTSNSISEKYFLQLAAYRMLIYQTKGISIDGTIILQLDKNRVGYNEYVLDFSNDDHYKFIEECHRAYMSLVYAYYNAHYIKERYNGIFNEGKKN